VSHLLGPPHWPSSLKGCNPYEQGQGITVDWNVDIVKGDLVVAEVICFCDIPETALGIHKSKYGLFGVGFPRRFLMGKGARSVIYVPFSPRLEHIRWRSSYDISMIEGWKNAWDAFNEFVILPNPDSRTSHYVNARPRDANESIDAVNSLVTRDFFSFLKAFDCDLPEDEITNYYMEREWRMIGHLSFLKSDLSSVFVQKDYEQRLISDRPNYQAKIRISDD
jgi:Putative abortive phage resistance protein AbiGi, antitoxin